MEYSQALDRFVAKIDDFAATLTTEEQSMLAELISDDDVIAFGRDPAWPGLRTLAPLKLGDHFMESGGDPKIFRAETNFAESGGDPKI